MRFIFPYQQDVADTTLDEIGDNWRFDVGKQSPDKRKGGFLAAAGLPKRISPRREIIPAAIFRNLRIGRDHFYAGTGKIAPIDQFLGISLAHQKYNGRKIG